MSKTRRKGNTNVTKNITKVTSEKNIEIGDDLIGRDQNITTTTSSIATITINGVAQAGLLQLFAAINQRIDQQAVPADVKEELKENVKKIEEEVKKGKQADPAKVERWLKFVAAMSGDIFQVTAATLANPAAGVATAIRLIAQKAQQSQPSGANAENPA